MLPTPPAPGPTAIDGWSSGLADYVPARVEQITGVPARRLERLARDLAEQSPAVAIVGGPALAHTNALFHALAVNALNELLGAVGQLHPQVAEAVDLAEEIGEDSPAHEDVVEIRKAAERATQLTRQLLIFSRRDVVKPQPINLNDSVREMEKLLRRTLGEHIELRVQFGWLI